MMEWVLILCSMFIGLAWGLAVGSGFVAFITVLDIIPRLAQITNFRARVRWFEQAVIFGVIFWTLMDFYDVNFSFLPVGSAFIGWFQGMFIGMLAAALTEVLNVFPILAKRLKIDEYIIWLLMAVVFGKITGSLLDWLVFQKL